MTELDCVKWSQYHLYPSVLSICFSEGIDGSECSFTVDGPERKWSICEEFVVAVSRSRANEVDSKREF